MKHLLTTFLLMIVVTIMILPSINTQAQDGESDESQLKPQAVFIKIPGLADRFKQAMQKSEISLGKIAVALPRGDYKTIAEETGKIDSIYGLDVILSPEESDLFYSLISPEYIFADQDMHQYSNALQSAAQGKFLEESTVQCDLMMRACINCHYSFATERFPELAASTVDY